ncbi:MAG: hypothetical protein M3Y34_02550 [Actinomycetota bacterium]|nr:hypothetical protein [Actinomycetota bacterium]
MSNVTHIESAEITIRTARDEDMASLARVAARDTHAMPQGRLLVATVGTDVRAAISLDDGAIVADPFHRTAELVEMLKIRTAATRPSGSNRTARRRRLLHRPATVGRPA